MTAALEVARPEAAPETWREDFPKLVDDVLHAAVASKGPGAKPRRGQLDLVEDIVQTMQTHGHLTGVAGTGVGKSYALMAPALADAALNGNRTLISTHSIALQSQFYKQDRPVMQDAVEKVTGYRPEVSILKGWSNYTCAVAVEQLASDLFGVTPPEDVDGYPQYRELVLELISQRPRTGAVSLRGKERDLTEVLDLLSWCLVEGVRDRADYTGELTGNLWSLVSTTTDDCIGTDCPLAEICSPRTARQQAGEADVVITNHTLLGIQAATGAKVVMGNKTLGPFSTIEVDEAHELPGVTRDRGTISFNGNQVAHVGTAITRFVDAARKCITEALPNAGEDWEGRLRAEASLVDELALYPHYFPDLGLAVDRALSMQYIDRTDNEIHLRAGKEIDLYGKDIRTGPARRGAVQPLSDHTVHESMDDILSAPLACFPDPEDAYPFKYPDATSELLRNRAMNPSSRLRDWLRSLRPPDDHVRQSGSPSMLRSASDEDVLVPVAECAPVDVASLLARNLWNQERWVSPRSSAYRRPCLRGLSRTAGLDCLEPGHRTNLPTTTATAIQRCMFPVSDHDEIEHVATTDEDEVKLRFDHTKHRAWAMDQICRLVEANGGSGLILSTSKESGAAYAESLRELKDREYHPWDVLSQWDGRSTEEIVKDWKSDISAVLVGTKSLMTGVDAPGGTCSLVVLDRVPRNGQSAIDEARARHLSELDGIGLQEARDFIYVSDAAAKLEQAAGRLIRSTDDKGMLATPGSPPSPGTVCLTMRTLRERTYRRSGRQVQRRLTTQQRGGRHRLPEASGRRGPAGQEHLSRKTLHPRLLISGASRTHHLYHQDKPRKVTTMSAPVAPEFALTVITKGKDCVQCGATERALKKKGLHADIDYKTLDANLDENRQIGLELNYMQAPVLLVHDTEGQLVDSWSGFNPGKVNEWADKLTPPAEELLAA